MGAIDEAVARAAAVGNGELRRLYSLAVAHGRAATLCEADQERTERAVTLLALAVVRLPDLLLYAHLAEAADGEDCPEALLEELCEPLLAICSATLRLTHRALEAYALQVWFETPAWIGRSVEQTEAQLATERDSGVPMLVDQGRQAALALTAAIASLDCDHMQVCEQLATGLGHLLGIYVITSGL